MEFNFQRDVVMMMMMMMMMMATWNPMVPTTKEAFFNLGH
jgi:hypothetical protein